MIKDLFIPQEIRNYYVIPTRIIGFDISKTHVSATQVVAKGRSIIIEKWFSEQLDSSDGNDYDARVSTAIRKIMDATQGNYQAIYSAMSSAQAYFKELTFPFTDPDVISRVVYNEIESLLPFPINEAVIDFVITKQHTQEKSATVLIAAVQKQHVAHHLALFEAAGVSPTKITIDLLGLYGLYMALPYYRTQKDNTCLIEIGLQGTRMAYIQRGQLRAMRTLPQGIYDVAKSASEQLNISVAEALDHVIRYGLEKHAHTDTYAQAIQAGFAQLAKNINLTLTSFTALEHETIDSLLFFGSTASIKGMLEYFSEQLHVSSSIFNIHKALVQTSISIGTKNNFPDDNVVSLAVALPHGMVAGFNLRKEEFTTATSWQLTKQLITSALLSLLIIGSLLFFSMRSLKRLNKEAYASQEEVVETLKERFPKIPDETTDLDDLIAEAERAVNEEEKRFAVLTTARTSYLKYLLELTDKIDKEGLGLDLEKITFSADGFLTLQGSVRDYEALKNLERDLKKSKLFKLIEEGKEPQFTIVIRLLKNGQEKS